MTTWKSRSKPPPRLAPSGPGCDITVDVSGYGTDGVEVDTAAYGDEMSVRVGTLQLTVSWEQLEAMRDAIAAWSPDEGEPLEDDPR
jgi:hypothetical protein